MLKRFVAAARRLLGGIPHSAAHGEPTGTQTPAGAPGLLEQAGRRVKSAV